MSARPDWEDTPRARTLYSMANEGKASVEIVGDVSNFARQVEKDLNAALQKIRVDPVKVPVDTDQIKDEGAKAGASLADGITESLDSEIRNSKTTFAKSGEEVGAALGDGISNGSEKKTRSLWSRFAETGRKLGQILGDGAGKLFGDRLRKAVDKDGDGFGKGLLKKVGGVLKDGFGAVLSGAVTAGGKALGAAGVAIGGTLLAAVAAVIGPGLVSTVGAAITAALGVGLGAGLIGLGALFLKEAKPLKEAAKDLSKTFKDVAAEAAKPLLGPLKNALRDTGQLIRELKPEFKSIFKDLAPSIKPLNLALGQFVGALTRGIKDSMPGITAALKGFSNVLPEIGTRIGDFFRTIFQNSGLIDNATEGIFKLITSALRPLGAAISGLTVIFAAWNNFLKLASDTYLPMIKEALFNFVDGGTGAIARIKDAWGPLGDAIQLVWDKIKAFAGEDNEGKLNERFMAIVESIKQAWKPLQEFIGQVWSEVVSFIKRKWNEDFMPWWEGTAKPWLRSATESAFRAAWDAAVRIVGEKISQIVARIGAWLGALPGRIRGWLASIPGIFASLFAQAAARAAAGATQIVSGIMARIQTIAGRIRSTLGQARNAVIGAFAGAGSWLAGAGRQIIDGLVSGIQAGIGRVRAALNNLTSMLPSWKGPAAVDKVILRDSGRLVMKGFEQGILDSRKSIASTLGNVTGDLSNWAASGQRGYGSSTRVTGGLTFNINVSGATGQSAGQQAAEQVLKQLAAAGLVR